MISDLPRQAEFVLFHSKISFELVSLLPFPSATSQLLGHASASVRLARAQVPGACPSRAALLGLSPAPVAICVRHDFSWVEFSDFWWLSMVKLEEDTTWYRVGLMLDSFIPRHGGWWVRKKLVE